MNRAERRKAAQRGRAGQRKAASTKRARPQPEGERKLQTQFAFTQDRVVVRFDGQLNQLFFSPSEARAWAGNLIEAAKRVEDIQGRIARGEPLPPELQAAPPLPGAKPS